MRFGLFFMPELQRFITEATESGGWVEAAEEPARTGRTVAVAA